MDEAVFAPRCLSTRKWFSVCHRKIEENGIDSNDRVLARNSRAGNQSNMSFLLQLAEATDFVERVTIMNAAFRGISAERTFSNEKRYATGHRANERLLREEIAGGAQYGAQYMVAKEDGTSSHQEGVSPQALTSENGTWGHLQSIPICRTEDSARNSFTNRKSIRASMALQ
jgi:hypothetical protein